MGWLVNTINKPDFKKVCLMFVLSKLLQFLPIDYLLYNAAFMFIAALSVIITKIALIKFSFFILFLYSLADHITATMYAASGKEIYYDLQLIMFDFYQYLFYGTICLIFAGLAKGNSGGRHERSNHKRFNLFRLRFLAGHRV